MLDVLQSGGPFTFSDENQERIKTILAKYPEGRQRSAVLPLLDLAQRQNDGWVSREAIEHIAEVLALPNIQVIEVATFYTMFILKPIGRVHIQLCGTTPCWLRGSDDVLKACHDMGLESGKSTEDGLFHLSEVECLGACCNAPMVQINDEYYEDLTYDSMKAVLEAFKRGETPKPGPQTDRHFSAPVGGPTVLKDMIPADAGKE
jgi:NADH-quinone oxidoreductase subunit E